MITEETKKYFKIPLDRITQCVLKQYIESTIVESQKPKEKALEIWDMFVSNNDFSDIPYQFVTVDKLQEYRALIENSDNVSHYIFPFFLIGFSPFWMKTSNKNKSC